MRHFPWTVLFLTALALLAVGCISGHPLAPIQPAATAPALDPRLLPAPSTLLAAIPLARGASSGGMQLARRGCEFLPGLPAQHAAVNADLVEFTPDWTGNGSSFANLACCTYGFVLSGYGADSQLHLDWAAAPPADAAWIGLANWDADRWDWFACPAFGPLDLPAADPPLAPYRTEGSDLTLLVVLCTGTQMAQLSSVRIGTIPPVAQLTAGDSLGVLPLDVQFDPSGSYDADGEIVKFEYDFDNDSVIDQTETIPKLVTHTFDTAGIHNVWLTVTDNMNATATRVLQLPVSTAWQTTWGQSYSDEYRAVACGTDGSIYCVGDTSEPGDVKSDILLVKYNALGALQWVRAWGSPAGYEYGTSLAVAPDGSVIVSGQTDGFGAGDMDLLLQCWTPAGELEWTRTWGGTKFDRAGGVAALAGAIYVSGLTMSFGEGADDVMFASFDYAGNLLTDWTWGGPGSDWGQGLAVGDGGSAAELFLTGCCSSSGAGGNDVLVMCVDEPGVYDWALTWGDSGDQHGEDIGCGAGGRLDICGVDYIDDTQKQDALAMELNQTDGEYYDSWVRTVGGAKADIFSSVLDLGTTGMALSGFTYSVSDIHGDGLLAVMRSGLVESLSFWDDSGDESRLNVLGISPIGGYLIAGYGATAAGVLTSDMLDVQTAHGALADSAITPEEVDGSVDSPDGTVRDLTAAGTVDTGGGGYDALLRLRGI